MTKSKQNKRGKRQGKKSLKLKTSELISSVLKSDVHSVEDLRSSPKTNQSYLQTELISPDVHGSSQSKAVSSESSKTDYMDELPQVTSESELDAMLHRALTQRDTFGKYLLAVAGINQADLRAVVEGLRNALTANTTKFAQSKGVITDHRDVIDWQSRLNAIEKWIRLLDLYGPKSDRVGANAARVLKVEVDLAPDLKRNRGLRSGPGGVS